MSHLIETVYNLLWGDLFTLPVGGGIGISLMAVLLLTAGVFFTLRTRLLPVRLFRDMIAAVCEKNQSRDSLSSFQTLIVSTATRVGMGNLVGVVAAVSAGGAGAVFWMWVTALLGASTSFVESTLAQKYRQPDPLYGGQRGGDGREEHHEKPQRRRRLQTEALAILLRDRLRQHFADEKDHGRRDKGARSDRRNAPFARHEHRHDGRDGYVYDVGAYEDGGDSLVEVIQD